MTTPQTVGEFVDSISGAAGVTRRTPQAVAGRLMEEVVELCLAAGLNPDKIMSHVMDSLHNQCVKAQRACHEPAPSVVYPSRMFVRLDREELAEEMADCSLVMKDLAYLTGIDVSIAEDAKWSKFITRKFNVSPHGTLYAIK